MPTIDMTTVKQIMHGDKEVIKIEDNLGNTMWQKAGPTPAGNRVYFGNYSGGAPHLYYSDDMQTFTATTLTDAGQTVSFPNSTHTPLDIWADALDDTAKIYACSNDNTTNAYYYELDLNNQTLTSIAATGSNAGTLRGSGVWTDGTDIYNAFTHKWNKTTGTWDSVTWNSTPSITSPSGQDIFKINNDIFYMTGSYISPKCYKIDTTTLTCTSVVVSGATSEFIGIQGRSVWSDGTNYYYNISGLSSMYKIEYNALNNTLSFIADSDWTNKPQYGMYTYKINNKFYSLDNSILYEIDITNKTMTYVTSITRGQYAFDKHGRLGTDASCHPRSA